MRCVDGASWNNKRLRLITFAFQIREHLVEYQASVPSNKAANVFTDDPSGTKLAYDAKHLRPEVAIIFRAAPSSSLGKRLTWEASREEIDRPSVIAPVSVWILRFPLF